MDDVTTVCVRRLRIAAHPSDPSWDGFAVDLLTTYPFEGVEELPYTLPPLDDAGIAALPIRARLVLWRELRALRRAWPGTRWQVFHDERRFRARRERATQSTVFHTMDGAFAGRCDQPKRELAEGIGLAVRGVVTLPLAALMIANTWDGLASLVWLAGGVLGLALLMVAIVAIDRDLPRRVERFRARSHVRFRYVD